MSELPIVMSRTGRVNTPPEDIRAALIAGVAAERPGYTANLPASLIEDITSTDVGALVTMDQGVTELINSFTPYGANLLLLNQMAATTGIAVQSPSNTSVYVVFSGDAGQVIPQGFTVSDGTHQYIVQDGGSVESGGDSAPLYCLATVTGSWSVPADTVTQIITSVPDSVTLTVNNPLPGTPSAGEQSPASLKAQVLRAFSRSSSQGVVTYLKTQLGNITGVQQRLISVQQADTGWKVLVGGGDPYAIAYAVFTSLFDITDLVGSDTPERNISVTLIDYPDTYRVTYVNPVEQVVDISLTWNTISPNTIAAAAVAQTGAPALAAYINAIASGQPINLFELQSAFQLAVAPLVPVELLTRMVFVVSIDGVEVPPETGTGIIAGDPEGYFTTNTARITIIRG